MPRNIRPKRGEVWYHSPEYDLPGSLYNKDRPVVIVSADPLNKTSSLVVGIPCTHQPKREMESHSAFYRNSRKNTVMSEQVRAMQQEDLANYKYTLSEEEMFEVDMSLIYALNLQKYVRGEYLNAFNKSKRHSTDRVHESYS